MVGLCYDCVKAFAACVYQKVCSTLGEQAGLEIIGFQFEMTGDYFFRDILAMSLACLNLSVLECISLVGNCIVCQPC